MNLRLLANIKQNPFFAFFYNAVGVPIAAGILYPFIASDAYRPVICLFSDKCLCTICDCSALKARNPHNP